MKLTYLIMNSLKYVENKSTGELWVVANNPNTPIMYINKDGVLHVPKDLVTLPKLPPVPHNKDTTLTTKQVA